MNATHAFLIVEALQLTAVVCATLALMFFAMRRSALRHALGVAGLALLLASPVLALLLPRPGWLPETQLPVEPIAAFESPMTEPADAPLVSVAPAPVFESLAMPLDSTWPDNTGMSASVPPDQSESTDILVEAVEPPLIAMTESVPPDRASNASASVTDYLSYVPILLGLLWIAGTVWSLVRWRRSHVRLSRLRASLTDWPAEHPIYDAGGICEELGLRRLPPVKVSDLAPMPLVLGITRPVIVLPRELAESPNPGRLRDVILHEAAHIARRDPLVFVGQRIVGALFWWHPGVHWLNRAINRAREEVCDNHVLRRGDASAYAEMLLELVENYAGLRLELSLMGLLAPRWSLEERITGLLNPGRNTATRAGRMQLFIAIAALVAVCAAVGGLGSLSQSGREALAADPVAASGATDKSPTERTPTDLGSPKPQEVPQAASAAPPGIESTTRTVTLRGICQDEEEVPLKGVHVRVFRFPSSIDPPILIADTTTGEDGKYEFSGLDSAVDRFPTRGIGDLFVAVTADGRRSAGSHISEESDEVERKLTLLPDAGVLEGFVHDERGNPISGATVYVPSAFEEPIPEFLSVVTDEQGRYALPHHLGETGIDASGRPDRFTSGRSKLHVKHPDHGVVDIWRPGDAASFDITLYPAAIVEGIVIDAVTDQPASGVIVTAQGIARNGFYVTRTNTLGRYELRMAKDYYNVWADMPERVCIAVKAILAQPGITASGANIRMVRGGFVYGIVTDPATGQPIAPQEDQKVYVAHQGPARPRTDGARAGTYVAPDGTYRLRVAPGRNFVGVNNPTETVDVQEGEEIRVDLTLREAHRQRQLEPDDDELLRERIRAQAEVEDEAALQRARGVGNFKPIQLPEHSDQRDGNPDTPSSPKTSKTGESSWGSIAGRFVLDGDVPELRPLLTRSGEEVPDESLIVNPDSKGIANICLYLREAPADIHPSLQQSSTPKVTFDANKNRFVPHILLARTDQQITLLNNEPFAVDVHPNPLRNAGINMMLHPRDRTGSPITMSRPETKGPPVNVKSDIQPWMQAYWIISDHPYVALTDADGKFQIDNLPAGEHKFRVWHERAGYLKTDAFNRDLTVTVQADETIELPEFHVSGALFEDSSPNTD